MEFVLDALAIVFFFCLAIREATKGVGLSWLPKKLGRVSLSDLIEASSDFKALPLDMNDPDDIELLRHVTFALNSFLKRCEKTQIRFKGNRINEVGKKFESILVEEIDKTPLEVAMLEEEWLPRP